MQLCNRSCLEISNHLPYLNTYNTIHRKTFHQNSEVLREALHVQMKINIKFNLLHCDFIIILLRNYDYLTLKKIVINCCTTQNLLF